jgi:hypothetical protein
VLTILLFQRCTVCSLDEKHGPHFKALRVADVLADKFMKGYVTCRQLALMVSCFPQGKLWIYDHCAAKKKDKDGKRAATPATATGQRPGTHHAGKKPFHFFGTFRVELIIALMPHTIDMFNFDVGELFLWMAVSALVNGFNLICFTLLIVAGDAGIQS